jgi:membrane-associated protease RseP (regulator of RpoE activity)
MAADVVANNVLTASTSSTIAGSITTTTITSITTTTITSILENVITTVGSPLLAILVLASVVLVHEAGHFLAARYFQIKVQEFSVGIGPKLLGYTSPKDQIDYSLRLIPFGGYVRFPENYNVTLAQQQEEEEQQRRRSTNSKNNKPSTSTTVSKAPTTTTTSSDNRLQQFLTNFFFFPKPSTTPDIITTSKSYKNDKSKSSSSVAALPIEYYTDPNLLQNRPWIQRLIVLSGGVIFNILLSFLLYLGQATVGYGLPKPTFAPGAMVTQEPYPALPSYGYLHPGDIIVEINGRCSLWYRIHSD